MREFERQAPLSAHRLTAELDRSADRVLVQGFCHVDLPKVEIWRADQDLPPGRIYAAPTAFPCAHC